MTGSEKQIEWATSIQAQFERILAGEIAQAQERVANGSMPATWAATVADAAQALRESIARDLKGQAGMWIEQRARILEFAKRVTALAAKRQG
jgi:hypothetical protein